jgi:glycosyltransferase involved in cell wall biosynthesis
MSPRDSARPRLVLDLRCLQDESRFRGIGTYARAVLAHAQQEAPRLRYRVEGCYYDWLGRLRCAPVEAICADELPHGLHLQAVCLNPRFRRRYSGLWFHQLARRNVWVHFMDQNNCPYEYGGPAIVTVHDIAPAILSPWSPNPLWVALEKRYLTGVLRWARQLVAVSEYSRGDLAQRFGVDPARVKVIYPPCPMAVAPPRAEPPRRQFFFVGGLDPRKNADRLVEAFLRFRERGGADYRLVLAGSHHAEDLVRLRRSFGHRAGWRAIDFPGYLSPIELAATMEASVALVFATLLEGFGYPPVEAMARGVPVICSTAGSLPEVVGDAALLVDPLDPDAIARAMAVVATDAAERRRLTRRGLSRAARFCGDRSVVELFELYETCLADRAPAALATGEPA